jgi:hypothetical protein
MTEKFQDAMLSQEQSKKERDYEEWAKNSKTFLLLKNELEGKSNFALNIGDSRGGAGIVAKIMGEKGGEVMFFEWEDFTDEGESIGKRIPSEALIKIGINLAEKLESGDTAKLGPEENDGFIHTTDPERVLKMLAELEIEPSEGIEPPTEGYKRSTIGFRL